MSLAYFGSWLVTMWAILYLKVPVQLRFSAFLRSIVLPFSAQQTIPEARLLVCFAYTSHFNYTVLLFLVVENKACIQIFNWNQWIVNVWNYWDLLCYYRSRWSSCQLSSRFLKTKSWAGQMKIIESWLNRPLPILAFWTLCAGHCNMDCFCAIFHLIYTTFER